MLQLRLKWITQRRLGGTLHRRLSGKSPRHFIGTLRQRLKRMLQRRPISTSPRRLQQVSNETPFDVSVVRRQDVSMVRIFAISLLRLYNVFFKSQMKHSITSLWHGLDHVSELHCCDVLLVVLYYVFKLLCHYLDLVGLHVSLKYQMKHQNFLVPSREGSRKSNLDYKLAEFLLHLKTTTNIA